MHLKSLTLRGFKSFASATTLRFEPGITAVVGPNGSGKSNVVDAIAWVLGEQGAKALRGGKMEDVIFAGTSGRPPLGRAEVTLTIDNNDGALPIEFAEVSITRRMFREGSSEYEINGESARLLDIQELLSDSGIGREMHVIVGQGQLDAVLQARPEDRRGFIEEAAGVLKHRKRKEKALRKLDAMQANLTRITDLTTELRRQLKPLGRQAEIARRAQGVQAELRDSRLRLLADDLLTLRDAIDREVADEEAIRARRTQVETSLSQARARETELDEAMAADAPLVVRTQDVWHRLSTLEERLRGTASLATERARHLSAEADDSAEGERSGRDPEVMEAEAGQVREQETELQQQLDAAHAELTEVVSYRQDLERRLTEAERAVVAAVRAVADRREGLARLTGQVNALRTRAGAARDESERLAAAAADARARASEAEIELDRVQSDVGALDAGELGLDARHENAVAAFEAVEASVRELTAGEREAERERSTWTARADALVVGLTRKDGTDTLLSLGLSGVRGSLADLITVTPGYEAAIAAALGGAADAVAVDSIDVAVAGLAHLKAEDAGRAGFVRGDVSGNFAREGIGLVGAQWADYLVQVPAGLEGAVDVLLAGTVVTDDPDRVAGLLGEASVTRVVTRDGDVFGAAFVYGGSASGPSAIEISASIDEARQKADEAATRYERFHTELDDARTEAGRRRAEVEAALEALHESDAALSAVAEQLAQLGQVARSAGAEAARLDDARAKVDDTRDKDLAGLADLEERLRLAESASDAPAEPDTAERDGLQEQVAEARQGEMEARLQVRSGEERVRSLKGRADQLLRAAEIERNARRRRQEAREARARGAVIAAEVRDAARAAVARIADSVSAAVIERDTAQQARAERETEAAGVRGRVRELAEELGRLTDAVHRDEVMRAEQRMRAEQLEQRAADEYGVELDTLVTEYGPDQPCPPSAIEVAEYEQARERGEQVTAPQPGPYDRAVQEKRAARADRDLALLGKVNPLALEEFAALEERHQFLSTQLEDLKATRRDLLTVVKEVDDRILEVFTLAYHDVAREFQVVFATLFPGGEGRLVLTEPDDMLLTGIDVEARPPGKKVKRLSLLSGGERSLVAVALLVAIFRARPSPFYVMDEIEAALDDVNLGRLLELISQLRESSQIIQITHQKRTMEIADALYGVTMRGDGVTQVISQRLRDAG